MAKFSKLKKALGLGPTATVQLASTHNGGVGFATDDKTALYSLAVTNFVSETTYYEAPGKRDDRFVELVHAVAKEDPQWVVELATWLRTTAQMRSAPIVIAAEYARARGANARRLVDAVCQRADEPAELLGYWLSRYGKPLPMALKRGLADAATRLYNEHAVVKWDSPRTSVRMADVIEFVHPKPVDDKQSELFHYILDARRKRDDIHVGHALSDLADVLSFESIERDDRRSWIAANALPKLVTWERLSGWLPNGMDAEAWENAIDNMGYMALLRNLRNFEKAGVSSAVLDQVARKLADADEVTRSRQLPFRFWSAYKASGSTRFAHPIEEALQTSLANVPTFTGRTLVAVDTSGSMQSPVSGRSKALCLEVAAVFAAAISKTSDVDVMIYADNGRTVKNLPVSALRTVEKLRSLVGSVGHGTSTWPSVLSQYKGQDRIIVFTDMQDDPSRQPQLPNVPVYVWDLRGYGVANIQPGSGRYLLSGFNDASFGVVNLLEQGRSASWPWSA